MQNNGVGRVFNKVDFNTALRFQPTTRHFKNPFECLRISRLFIRSARFAIENDVHLFLSLSLCVRFWDVHSFSCWLRFFVFSYLIFPFRSHYVASIDIFVVVVAVIVVGSHSFHTLADTYSSVGELTVM